jgi:hypothetical protein
MLPQPSTSLTIPLLDGRTLSFNATIGLILHVLNDPKKGSEVELNLLVCKTEFPQFPYVVTAPPADHNYLLFPKELVRTSNVVKLFLSSFLLSEAFVFRQVFVLEGDG